VDTHCDFESLLCDRDEEQPPAVGIPPAGELPMLMTKERRSAIRTLRGWAISVLQDGADPHARKRAFDIARQDPPDGCPGTEAIAEIEDVLASIGDTCPECPPDC